MKKITDKQRLDFIEQNQFRGASILNDDNDHWAVINCSHLNVHSQDLSITKITDREEQADTTMEFMVQKLEWKNSLREAIDAYIEECNIFDCDDGRNMA